MRLIRFLSTSFWPGAAFASTAAVSLTLNIISKLTLLLTSILLARWLGPAGFGIYVSVIAILMLMSVSAQLGFPTLVIRLTSAYVQRREWSLLSGLLRSAASTITGSALLLALAGIAVAWVCSDFLPEIHVRALAWAMAILPITAFLNLIAGTLRGFHRVIAGQLTDSCVVPLLFLVFILAWHLTAQQGRSLTADLAMAARFLATLIALFVAGWYLIRSLPSDLKRTMPRYDRKVWMHAALPLAMLAGLNIVNTQADVLMLALIQGVDSAGIYQAAARGGELVALSLLIVGGIAQPTISALYSRGDFKELQRLVTTSARLAFAVSVPMAIVLISFSESILRFVYGPEFEQGSIALTILCAAQIVNVGTGLVGQVLVMTGHERDAAFGLAIGAVVNLVLNAVLIPFLGIKGAAIATGVSLVVWNIYLMWLVRRRTGLKSWILPTLA